MRSAKLVLLSSELIFFEELGTAAFFNCGQSCLVVEVRWEAHIALLIFSYFEVVYHAFTGGIIKTMLYQSDFSISWVGCIRGWITSWVLASHCSKQEH
jgi:hypothetical protein